MILSSWKRVSSGNKTDNLVAAGTVTEYREEVVACVAAGDEDSRSALFSSVDTHTVRSSTSIRLEIVYPPRS
jgi:hypothetical protein